MDKDRDISRPVTTIAPKRVGFVGSAVLAGSALLAACGGGAKSSKTLEGGVAGAALQPGGGSSPIVVETAGMPSATAVVEAPTVAPTATVEAQLTQKDKEQIGQTVLNEITKGFSGVQIDRSKLSNNDEASLNFLSQRLDNCVSKNGEAFEAAPGHIIGPDYPGGYWSILMGQCEDVAQATKDLYNATGRVEFLNANRALEPVARSVFTNLMSHDPRVDESNWQPIKRLYFLPE